MIDIQFRRHILAWLLLDTSADSRVVNMCNAKSQEEACSLAPKQSQFEFKLTEVETAFGPREGDILQLLFTTTITIPIATSNYKMASSRAS